MFWYISDHWVIMEPRYLNLTTFRLHYKWSGLTCSFLFGKLLINIIFYIIIMNARLVYKSQKKICLRGYTNHIILRPCKKTISTDWLVGKGMRTKTTSCLSLIATISMYFFGNMSLVLKQMVITCFLVIINTFFG